MRKMENWRWKTGTYFHEKLKLMSKLKLSEADIIQYMIEGVDNYVLRRQSP